MADETATNPVGGEDNAEATLPDGQEVDTEGQQADAEQQFDDDGNPIDPPDESEEIEHEGKKYAVPKALKPLLLMQADYTKKTQEVAEERRAMAAERQSMHQISQAEFQAAANAQASQSRMAQWDAYAAQFGGWAAWSREDPFAAQEADMDRKEHERVANGNLAQLNNLRGQRAFQQQQNSAKLMEQGRAALAKDIPEWSDTHKAKLIDFAAGFGFSRDELSDLEADPRVAKVLHAAFAGQTATTTARKVQNIQAQQAVQPAASVKARGAPPAGVDDRLSADEWMRRRNAQVRKRA